MSLNKVIIGFIIILLLFGGYVVFQMTRTPIPPSKVTINKHTFSAEIATSAAQQQQGLSGRKSLPQDQGMLFVFKTADHYPFWMKGMHFPIDIIFIKNKEIVSISENIPVPKGNTDNLPVYTPDAPADQALEINAGLVKKYGFKKGDTFKVELK